MINDKWKNWLTYLTHLIKRLSRYFFVSRISTWT